MRFAQPRFVMGRLACEEKMDRLVLYPLKRRKMRPAGVDVEEMFAFVENLELGVNRGFPLKAEMGHHFYSILSFWNSLPQCN